MAGPAARSFAAVAVLLLILGWQCASTVEARAAGLAFESPPVDVSGFQDNLSSALSPSNSAGASVKSAKPVFRKDRLFGTLEFKTKLKNLPKWQRILNLYKNGKGIDHAFTVSNRKREAQAWEKLKAEAAGAGVLEKAKKVNTFFNQWPYRTDQAVYGINDYWATPEEFIKNSGDCEDYAITKFYALKQLGVAAEQMRLVVLKDTIRNLDHAVLAVYIDEEVYILDNVTSMVMSHNNYMHYRPYYTLNEVYRWGHVPPSNK